MSTHRTSRRRFGAPVSVSLTVALAVAGVVALDSAVVTRPALAAEEQSATATMLIRRLKQALEPDRSLATSFRIVIEGPSGGEVVWRGVAARKRINGAGAVVGTLLEPASIEGYAFLAREREGAAVEQWFYSPPLRRARKLVYAGRFQSFLGTELTFQDLGLLDIAERHVSYLGDGEVDGRRIYRLQEVPFDRSVYSRIVTTLDAETYVPLRREYYDPGGVLWRVAEYEDAEEIDGASTVRTIRVHDVQAGGRTRLELTRKVVRGADLPDELFEPAALVDLAVLAALGDD